MAYQQLIMCVDNSGSMSGSKIRDSINYLNQIAAAFNCKTIYFRFGCKVDQISSYSESTLPCNDGTQIQNCLKDLYGNQLRRYTGSKTKFIFVTDAEDSINDVSSVQSAKTQCESAFGNNLHSYCLLVGASGGCSSELQRIFSANSFNHVTQNKFRSILKEITAGIETAVKLEKVNINIQAEINTMTQDSNSEIRAFGVEMNTILDTVQKAQHSTETAKRELSTAKTNIDDLNRQKTSVTTQVQNAHTDPEVDAAEAVTRALKKGYQDEGNRLNKAGEILETAKTELKVGSDRANAVAQKLEENTQKLGERAKLVIANIIAGIKDLESIQHGSYEQVADLRKRFRSSLDELMEVVTENSKLQDELKQAQTNILDSLKSYKRGRTELDGLKQTVLNNIQQINQLLEVLDERC